MGLLLDGSSWIQSTSAYNRTSADHTVMYWLRLDSNVAVRRPFGNTGAWEARTGAGSNVLTSDYLQAGTLGTVTLTGGWDHVAFVQDVTGGNRFAYLNGTLVGTVASATFAAAQNGNLSLGVTAGGSTQGWLGGIDDVRVYDRIVPTDEIETIWALRGNDGILDSLVHWFPLDEDAEGATVAVPLVNRGTAALNLVTVTGTPTFDYSCGIKRGRVLR